MSTSVTRSVLVVDDVSVNRMLALAILRKLGWICAEVDGGNAALDWLANNPPVDLVMLDIRMPDCNGEEVCRQLRGNPSFATLPIIAYTAHALPSDVERFMATGFTDVLIKPISVQNLKDLIARLYPE
jgi:CheY-like chemotaxis protein